MLASALKISILLFLSRLIDRHHKPVFRWCLRILHAVSIGYLVGFIIVHVFSCAPIHSWWDRASPQWRSKHKFTCIDDNLNILMGSVVGVPVDFVLALLPMCLLVNMKLRRKQKITLAALFSLAFWPSIAAGVRTYYVYLSLYGSWDFTCKTCAFHVHLRLNSDKPHRELPRHLGMDKRRSLSGSSLRQRARFTNNLPSRRSGELQFPWQKDTALHISQPISQHELHMAEHVPYRESAPHCKGCHDVLGNSHVDAQRQHHTKHCGNTEEQRPDGLEAGSHTTNT